MIRGLQGLSTLRLKWPEALSIVKAMPRASVVLSPSLSRGGPPQKPSVSSAGSLGTAGVSVEGSDGVSVGVSVGVGVGST